MTPVAKLGRGIGSIAKRPVKVAGELRAVTHHRHQIESMFVERRSNSRHAAIHHVARTDAVRASFRKGDCRFRQLVQSFFEFDASLVQHRTMSMRRIRTETRIDPKAQAAAELAANLRNGFVSRLMIKAALSFSCRHRKKQKLRNAIV